MNWYLDKIRQECHKPTTVLSIRQGECGRQSLDYSNHARLQHLASIRCLHRANNYNYTSNRWFMSDVICVLNTTRRGGYCWFEGSINTQRLFT